MKKATLITLAALTIAVPSIASAQGYNANVRGHGSVVAPPVVTGNANTKVVLIDGPDRNTRPDRILIDGPDRNNRPDMVINVNDHDRRDWDRRDYNRRDDRRWDDRDYSKRWGHHYNYNRYDFYRHNQARFYGPKTIGYNRCGYGQVSYRLPNGRMMYDNVYMCQTRYGEWVVANR